MYKAFCDQCDRNTDHKADVCQKCGQRYRNMVERFRDAEGLSELTEDDFKLPPTPQIFPRRK